MPSKVADYVRTPIDRSQGRSVVMSVGGIAASEHPLASQAGAAILAKGGSAVDAAIAVNAAMGVVAPMMNGVGGDLFAIVYDAASGELHEINASGGAPLALTLDRLVPRMDSVRAAAERTVHRRARAVRLQRGRPRDEHSGRAGSMVGGGQSVMRDDASGVNYVASDPRKDGAAIPAPFLA